MDGNEIFEILLASYVENADGSDRERKITFQYFLLLTFAPVPLEGHLPNKDL